jgi:hypothetical protein
MFQNILVDWADDTAKYMMLGVNELTDENGGETEAVYQNTYRPTWGCVTPSNYGFTNKWRRLTKWRTPRVAWMPKRG